MFDANIYLDAARLIGEPFTWERFNAVLAADSPGLVPHPTDPAFDSLRALASVTKGVLPNKQRVESWTSNHIEAMVAFKAEQSPIPDDRGHHGLGWSRTNAGDLVHLLVGDLFYDYTDGGSVGDTPIPYGTPPLDHEDGCVFVTARDAGHGEDIYYERFCVTQDKGFREASLPGETDVLRPHEWIAKLREMGRQAATFPPRALSA